MTDVSLVVPVYNEARGLPSFISQIEGFSHPRVKEVIFVNDGSSDNSRELLAASLGVFKTPARLIDHDTNLGYGAALKTGIRNSTSGFVMTLDSDGQHDVEAIHALLSAPISDLVLGEREFNAGAPPSRALGRLVVHAFTRVFAGVKARDLSSGLRVWKSSLVQSLFPILPNGFSFSTTSLVASELLKINIARVPIDVRHRIGVSSMRTMDGFHFLALVFRLMLLFRPLRLFFPAALLLLLLGLVFTGISISSSNELSIKALVTLLASLTIFLNGFILYSVSELRQGKQIGTL